MNTVFRVARQIYNYNMNFKGVCKALDIGRTSLIYRLRNEGTTFTKILRAIRIRMARRLMQHGKTLECIGIELGYASDRVANYFITKEFGMTYEQCMRYIENSALQDMVFMQVQG